MQEIKRQWRYQSATLDDETKKRIFLEKALKDLVENHPPIFEDFKEFLGKELKECKERQQVELKDMKNISSIAKKMIKNPKTFREVGGLRLNVYEDFELPHDDFQHMAIEKVFYMVLRLPATAKVQNVDEDLSI